MYYISLLRVPRLSVMPVPRVRVVISGGAAFPEILQIYYIRYRPGMTIRQALAATGAVGFSYSGQIISVGGISLDEGVYLRMTISGRPFPPAAIGLPARPGDTISLYLRIVPMPLA